MLHAKFQDHRISASEEVLLKVLTIYGHGGHIGHVTRMIFTKFLFHLSEKARNKILL